MAVTLRACRLAGRRLLLALTLIVAATAARAEDGAGDARETMMWGGRERAFLVHMPVPAGDALPLVLVFHGANDSAPSFAMETGFGAAGERDGFLVVFPFGTGSEPDRQYWNAHFCCGSALTEAVDDQGFVAALIDRLAQHYRIDRHRIYATGMSNGGMFAYQLAAARPDLFAAVAPVSAAIGGTSREGESFVIAPPGRPVSVLAIHGRRDGYVLFNGGVSPVLNYPKRSNMAVADALAFWAKADGCAADPTREDAVPGELVRLAYRDCAAGSAVILWEISKGEHAWPEGNVFPGPEGTMRSAAEEILAFFAKHRLP